MYGWTTLVFASLQNQMTEEQEEQSDELWEAAHARNAAFLYNQFVSLEGLWVKLGQFLSSRADVMPAKYVEVLSQCQDSLPARPFASVKQQVETELGQLLPDMFEAFEEEPIACASIAQVHKAVLKGGQRVVVKVQHEKVGKRLLQDLDNLQTIGDIMKRVEPDFDFSPVIREWANSIPNELDFEQEKRNLHRVSHTLAQCSQGNAADALLGVDVSLPVPVEGFVSKRVLVMSYVDGFKVDDEKLLDRYA